MRRGQVIRLGRTAEIVAWTNDQVLKLFHEGWSISAVKWEEKVARIVSRAGLPVPAVYGIIEVKGRYGILYDRLDGPSMLKELMSRPKKLEHSAGLFAELHADMHSLRVEELPSQHQQLEAKIRNAEEMTNDLRQTVLEALYQLPDDNVLCHGDFHPDNIIMSKRGPFILDWNDAARGRSEADIARTLLLLQKGQPLYPLNLDTEMTGSVRTQFVKTYLEQYNQIRSISIEEIQMWQLPVIAARLSEDIKEEVDGLLSILKMLCTGSERLSMS